MSKIVASSQHSSIANRVLSHLHDVSPRGTGWLTNAGSEKFSDGQLFERNGGLGRD